MFSSMVSKPSCDKALSNMGEGSIESRKATHASLTKAQLSIEVEIRALMTIVGMSYLVDVMHDRLIM